MNTSGGINQEKASASLSASCLRLCLAWSAGSASLITAEGIIQEESADTDRDDEEEEEEEEEADFDGQSDSSVCVDTLQRSD